MVDRVEIDASLDEIFQNLPFGSISRAIANNLYGINMTRVKGFLPKAKDSYGFVFFTKPQLNLSRLNISNFRAFYGLLNTNRNSYQSYVRYTLDPRLAKKVGSNEVSPFVDTENVFIPILTNTVSSVSGWPDLVVPTYTSEAGLYNQEVSFVDGVVNHYESYDLDVSFDNIKGHPLIYMFYIWVRYESLVFEGILNPYMDYIIENEIDYNTRIYRVILDPNKRYVTNIACTGAAFPLNVPTGSIFDYNEDSPVNANNNQINIRFRCMGFLAFEDIIKLEFNKSMAIFNQSFKNIIRNDLENENDSSVRDDPTALYSFGSLTKVPPVLTTTLTNNSLDNAFFALNFRAYPYINLYTNELEWWVNSQRLRNFTSEVEYNNIPTFIEGLNSKNITYT